MPDIATISAFFGSLKTATELAKAIKNVESSFEKAELKLKIIELIDALADAKINATEVQDLVLEKDRKITELENALKFKLKLVRKDGAYVDKDESVLEAEPYCSHCWEVNKIPVHLSFIKCVEIVDEVLEESRYSNLFICPSCKNKTNYP